MQLILTVACFINIALACRERPTTVALPQCHPIVETVPAATPYAVPGKLKIHSDGATATISCQPQEGDNSSAIVNTFVRYLNGKEETTLVYWHLSGNSVTMELTCEKNIKYFGRKYYVIESKESRPTLFGVVKETKCYSFNSSNEEKFQDDLGLDKPFYGVCENIEEIQNGTEYRNQHGTHTVSSGSSTYANGVLQKYECPPRSGYGPGIIIADGEEHDNGRYITTVDTILDKNSFPKQCWRTVNNRTGYGRYSPVTDNAFLIVKIGCAYKKL